jgi:hypothetical protein
MGQLGQMGPQIDQMLKTMSYPINKNDLMMRARQAGANSQVVDTMQRMLPDKTFKSADEIKSCFGSRGSQTRM